MNLEAMMDRMPVRTWERLNVNEVGVALPGPDVRPSVSADHTDFQASPRILIERDFSGQVPGKDATKLFVPPDMAAFIDDHANWRLLLRIPKDHVEKEPIVLSSNLDSNSPVLVDDIFIDAEEGSSADIILKYASESGDPVQHCGRTRILVHRNARVSLTKIQMLNGEAGHVDAVGGVVQERARLDVILAEIGANRPLSSCNVVLDGENACAQLDTVYLGDGERSLDMSYRMEHRGRKTVSNICARGILLEKSKKVFRDTLDFVSGASGSKGREEESVLMLGPEVRNVSVPLLLCGEDEVEGEHAASSGRPDGKILFYLMSRGLTELDAKKLLAEAAVSSIVEKIPDASVRDEITAAVRRAIEKGEQTA